MVALAGDGATLNVLAEQPNGQYIVMTVTTNGANADGSPKTTVTTRFDVGTAGGETPELIAVTGVDVYISYTRNSAALFGVWHYVSPLVAPPRRARSSQRSQRHPKAHRKLSWFSVR